MTYDQAQSPRLGQRTPVESTYVRMFSGDEIPEAAWPGQIIYRNETQGLQIYNGNAWENVVGGAAGTLTFVGPTPPVSQAIGDIWFDSSDGNQMYRAASVGADAILVGEWENLTPVVSGTGATVYHQDTPPGGAAEGDLWFETDNGNKPYVYVSGLWVSVRDDSISAAQAAADAAAADAAAAAAAAATANAGVATASASAAVANTAATNAMSAAVAAQATADGSITTYYVSTAPWANGSSGHAVNAGDMWFDIDDGQAYRWNDSTTNWDIIEDNSIAAALAAASTAQTTADGKITAYYATARPWADGLTTHTLDYGDIWYDTTAGLNKPYYWATGNIWTSVQDSSIAVAQAAADAAAAAAATKIPLVPIAIPTASPAIVKVTGTISSLGVQVANVELGTSIEYHISTTTGFTPDSTTKILDTQSTIGVIDHLPDNTPLLTDVIYYLKTKAYNVVGYATAVSAEATGLLNPANLDTFFTNKISAGFVLSGNIKVGQIELDAVQGMTIGPGGSALHFPVDGTNLEMTAALDATQLNVQNNLSISGSGTVYGNLGLNSGMTAPLVAPTMGFTYPTIWPTNFSGFDSSADASDARAGLIEKPGSSTQLAFAGMLFGTVIAFSGKDGSNQGDMGTGAWSSQFYAKGGITYIANPDGSADPSYYLLGQDYNRSSSWYIYRIRAGTNAKISELYLGGWATYGTSARPTLFTDGNYVCVIGCATGTLNMKFYNPVTYVLSLNQNLSTLSGQMSIGAAFYGDAGLGATRLFVSIKSAAYPTVLCYTTAWARDSFWDFPRAGMYSGMTYDTTAGQMLAYDVYGKMWFHGEPTPRTLVAKMAWYDGDATGGTHETVCGPASTSYVLPPRSYAQLSSSAPPDAANTDTSNHDRANQVKIYVSSDGGTVWRRTTQTAAPWSWSGTAISTLSTDTPNAGTAFGGAVIPGKIHSAALRRDGTPKTALDGAGLVANIDGLIPPGVVVMSASGGIPSGWLQCDGSAVSRTTYLDLWCSLGGGTSISTGSSPWGNGDGSTTFNLPDMRSRLPIGAGTLAGVGGNEGDAVETDRATRFDHRHTHTVAGHVHAHSHTHTQSDHTHGSGTLGTDTFTHTNATNTTVTGSNNRLVSPAGHSHTVNSGQTGAGTNPATSGASVTNTADSGTLTSSSNSLAAGSIANHPFSTIYFIVKT